MPGRAVTTNAGNIALKFRRRADGLKTEVEKELRATMKDAKKIAIGYSSARAYNPKRDKTHPYGRTNPHPPLPPFLANIQSGTLRGSWKTRVQRTPFGWRGTLYNTAPHARNFGGQPTRRMIGRPLFPEIQKAMGPKRRRRMRMAVRRSLGKR